VSQPTQTCQICGRVEIVTPDGRGFPPDIAKRRLAKLCKADGHVSQPKYLVGMQ
jgi:hypothetical protein